MGRGGLAGPVVAACVILEPEPTLLGVNDNLPDGDQVAPIIVSVNGALTTDDTFDPPRIRSSVTGL